MSHLTKDDIKKLSELCRIDCTEAEQESLLKDLLSILDYVDQLKEVDTRNVPPCNHILAEIHNVMREDTIGETLSTEAFLRNADSRIGNMVRVPTVIAKSGVIEGGE